MLSVARNIDAEEPSLSSWFFIIEKENICCNTCVWAEYTARQTHNCMKVKICKELFLKIIFCIVVSKQESIWDNYCCTVIDCVTFDMNDLARPQRIWFTTPVVSDLETRW